MGSWSPLSSSGPISVTSAGRCVISTRHRGERPLLVTASMRDRSVDTSHFEEQTQIIGDSIESFDGNRSLVAACDSKERR